MAAGLGTRMKSSRPKHLHTLLGRRMVDWVVEAARPLRPSPFVVVCSPGTRAEMTSSLHGVELVVQAEARGTGDAVAAARPALGRFEGDILVLSGDAALLTAASLEGLVEEHRRRGAAVTVLSMEPSRPLPYGRILRAEDAGLLRIVEEKDATANEREVGELNTSIYVFRASDLWWALERLDAENAQGELYLTDTVGHLVAAGRHAAVHPAAGLELAGVNDRVELALATALLRNRVLEGHMLAGATIVDPATTWVEPEVELEPDTVVHPFTVLRGRTIVRADAEIGPHVVAVDAEVGPRCTVGPFAYLRPGTVLAAGAKAGTFVEVKNARIGERTKVPHLSYIGDAEIGEDTNIGAGAITANYRSERFDDKQLTMIGDDVHTGSQNVFVPPVRIGDHAWTGAGSTITDDVPAGALAIARARQVNKENFDDERKRD